MVLFIGARTLSHPLAFIGSSNVYVNHSEIQNQLKRSQDLLNTNSEQSLALAFHALELSTQQAFDPGIIEADRIIGENYINQANFPEGFRHLIQAMDRSEETRNDEGKAAVLNSLGQFYLVLEQYPKSIGYFSQSVQLSKEKNFELLEALATSNLASAYQQTGNVDQAEKLLRESLVKIKDKKFSAIEATAYQTLGRIAFSRKKFDESLIQYSHAMDRFQDLNDNKGQLNTLLDMGKTYLEMLDAQRAEFCFQQVLEKSRKLKYPNLELESYRQLAEVYNMSGNYLRSQENYKIYVKLKDKAESLSKFLVITQLNSNRILEAKQRSIEELLTEREKTAAMNRWRNGLFLVLAILLPIIISVSIGLYIVLGQKKKVNGELIHQKEELEKLNVVKDRLFSIIGHDLRSPLANLEAILKLMDSGDLGLNDLLILVKQLTNDVQETSIMLENLLHWSNSQMKGIPPNYENVELLKIAKDTFTFLRPQSEKKSISLKISNLDNCITFGDKEMIRLIMRNLVANAIKFTPNEGMITIEIVKLENEAKVSVIDTGIGIKDENLRKIFSNQPITTRGTQNEKGTGLGLMLCKDFVEKNNGKIWVTSELGKGSTFSFTIPMNMKVETKKILEEASIL
jgi:signal transduction histidine kinase